MDFEDAGTLTVEAAVSLFIVVLAWKLWRARITVHSGCCGSSAPGITIDTDNPGVSDV